MPARSERAQHFGCLALAQGPGTCWACSSARSAACHTRTARQAAQHQRSRGGVANEGHTTRHSPSSVCLQHLPSRRQRACICRPAWPSARQAAQHRLAARGIQPGGYRRPGSSHCCRPDALDAPSRWPQRHRRHRSPRESAASIADAGCRWPLCKRARFHALVIAARPALARFSTTSRLAWLRNTFCVNQRLSLHMGRMGTWRLTAREEHGEVREPPKFR